MPIEDVDYLLKHSVPESTLLFVDSSMRDNRFYLTPSEYVIELEEPLRNVFGIDVLDATIPGTMYNVDLHNNTIALLSINSTASQTIMAARSAAAAAAPPGAPPERLLEMREGAETKAILLDLHTLGFNADLRDMLTWPAGPTWAQASGEILGEAASSQAEPPNIMVFSNAAYTAANLAIPLDQEPPSAPRPHLALVRQEFSGVPLYRPQSFQGPPASFVYSGTLYALVAPDSMPANRALTEWLASNPPPFALVPSSVTHSQSEFGGAHQGRLYDIIFFEARKMTAAEKQHRAARNEALYTMSILRFVLEPGNYTLGEMQLHLQQVLGAHSVDVVTTSSGAINKQSRLRLVAHENARFIMLLDQCKAASLLGFETVASLDMNAVPLRYRQYTALLFGDVPAPMFMSALRSTPQDGTPLIRSQVLDAPGLVNVLGVRYIKMRCKEIEEHMGGIGKYGRFSTGIGVFKLLSANEVANLRFDFVSLIRKPFHPIGRLSRLTLRFEMTDGNLYDFKGVNHQLLITLKCWVPTKRQTDGSGQQAGAPPRSILNPDYNADFLQYVITQTRDAARIGDDGADDSDDDESSGCGSGGSSSGSSNDVPHDHKKLWASRVAEAEERYAMGRM